jgi:hypothetical protein
VLYFQYTLPRVQYSSDPHLITTVSTMPLSQTGQGIQALASIDHMTIGLHHIGTIVGTAQHIVIAALVKGEANVSFDVLRD